ncbi:MAG: 50S ribosomal protein L3, partial [Candidatus Moranbacteria bacterium]|nr:50S ribosomal protein L3 [Candidatus Moranbacteria bacterium]
MRKFILGKKIGMTTVYDKDKGALNVTLIECVPNKVSLIRSEDKDGYFAIQLSMEKSKKDEFKKEFRVSKEEVGSFKEGGEITLDKFELEERVRVSGVAKSKGFQGVMKRH